tara:strand:- start:254 stop:409 length:156 start_codon:yes stop_codon:yes gene_type:complete
MKLLFIIALIAAAYYIGQPKLTKAYNKVFKTSVEITQKAVNYHTKLINEVK